MWSLPSGAWVLARSSHTAIKARFSGIYMVRQAPISFTVRRQPMQWVRAASKVQTLTHGELIGGSFNGRSVVMGMS